ncbi:MerR family transcriptional regulator [Paenibacillus sp. FSL M7-1455]|uniref:MerR family transcriptional regulator n=1 Tax=Paenibacillus cookii TaxID=157839 RepID=A0ABQ4LVP9_9BACL|nr:MerR family transcriptional regulator [Paenibacillus cookii]KHF33250.1 HTH-type transcriptional activator mta [Paenibacillus sp. P1XP2]GIO67238.1 MerR family transcriptional regulator [Paenibacillus cookii]
MYTVGELSKKTGISIRTLHYYEKMNLLKPKRSPDNQYRLYGPGDVMRLQQIVLLKRMRFRLREIKEMFDQHFERQTGDDYDIWVRVIERQIAELQKEKEEIQKVEHLLQSSLYAMRATKEVRIEEMLGFIREIERQPDRKRQIRRLFFTEEEMEKLPSHEPADPLAMEWADILNELRAQLNDSPASGRSQRLAARIAAYAEQLFKDDEALALKYWDYIKPEPGEAAKIYGMDREVMIYIEQILEQYYTGKSTS